MTYDFYQISKGIFCHPQVVGGRPTVGKSRLLVSLVAPYLLAQADQCEIVKSLPQLSSDDVSNVEHFLTELLAGRIAPPSDGHLKKSTREYLLRLLQGVERYPSEEVRRAIADAGKDVANLASIEDMPKLRKVRQLTDVLEQSWVFVTA